MAEVFKFFNAVETSPGVFDREYVESDFADYFGSVLSTGLLHTNEVPGMKVSVESGTLNTVVSAGKAIMKGHLYENTTPLTLSHSMPEPSLDRIDRIVLRLDVRIQSRFIKLFVKEGVSASNPVAPVLQRDQFIYEISLAQIRVRKNTSQLQAVDLVDERLNQSLCGLVYSLISIPTDQLQDFILAKMNVMNEETAEFSMQLAQMLIDYQNEWSTWFNEIKTQLPNEAKLVSVEDVAGYFESSDVEGVLAELFQFADSGKRDIASVVGSPATAANTFAQLKTHIQNAKNTMASPLGIAGTSALATMASTLTTRRNSIASAVNAKGVPATSSDSLAALATKIGQIPTGKQIKEGTVTSSLTTASFELSANTSKESRWYVEVNGLGFTPSTILLWGIQGSTSELVHIYSDKVGFGFPKTVRGADFYGISGNRPTQSYKANVLPAKVISGGFLLPVIGQNQLYNYMAIEG